MAELPCPVRPEVKENHAVAITDRVNRVGVRRHDPRRLEELVGDPRLVALLDEDKRVGSRRAGRLDHGAVGLLRALPAFVAIHGVVAAAHRCGPAGPDPLQLGKQILHEPGRSEEHTSELQSQSNLVCRLLLEKKTQTYGALADRDRFSDHGHSRRPAPTMAVVFLLLIALFVGVSPIVFSLLMFRLPSAVQYAF